MQHKHPTIKGSPSYKKPPVVEVVVGAHFKELDDFLCAHLGILWDFLGRTEYPDCQEKMPLMTPPLKSEDSIVVLSKPDLPRVWFLEANGSSIVQFQRDRILYNWRKQDAEYPRYEAVIGRFFQTFDKFTACLKSLSMEVPTLEKLELTYINFIPVTDFGSCQDVGKILKDVQWQKHDYLTAPSKFSLYWQFGVPSNSALLNCHAAVVQHVETGEEMLRVELAVHGQALDTSIDNCHPWFESSHAAIVHGFTDLTTEYAHSLWGRYE